MKIAFDYTIFMKQTYGGISRYFVKLVKSLNETHQCRIIAPISVNNYVNEINNCSFNLIKLKKIPKFSLKLITNFNFLLSLSYMKCWKPDVIHKTYFNNHSYNVKNAKKILNVWDLSHEIYPELYNKRKNWRPKEISLKLADHVICSSYKTRADLEKYYNYDLNKTSVIYQGVDSLLNNENIIYDKKKYLLYVGSRLKYKNFENLLKALSLNTQILEDYKLICFGDETKASYEQELIKKLNLNSENILFISGDDTLLKDYYLNATALIYPSKNEGFGFPPLEAMALGCPVITSNNPAILEATNLEDYSFNPDSPSDMIKKIENIIYSKSNINFLIKYGINRIKNFTWSNTATKMSKIYKEIQ
jgi:glycosyltransferase involved in cell wall biosynthesis